MNNLPEAPKSATVKVISPSGFHWLCTVRGDDKASLMQDMMHFEQQVLESGWRPESPYQKPVTQATPPSTTAPRVHYKSPEPQGDCPHERTAQKQSTGKSKPENAGRWYEACANCGKFLKWV